MLDQINSLAILIAIIAWMASALIWYDVIFKVQWRAAAGKAPDFKPRKELIAVFVLTLVAALVIDFLLTVITPGALGNVGWLAGAILAVIIWFGFIFSGRTQEAVFRTPNTQLYWIEICHSLIGMLILGAIIGYWH